MMRLFKASLALAALVTGTLLGIARADDGAAVATTATKTEAKASYDVKGDYIDACACDVSCGCEYGANASAGKGCQGIIAFHITSGTYGDVSLVGLTSVALILKPVENVGASLGKMEGGIYLDSAATPEQRKALLALTQDKLTGFFGTMKEPKDVPITVTKINTNGAEVANGYTLVIPKILNLAINGYTDENGKASGRINVPHCFVPIEYQAQATVHTYSDPDWATEWDFKGQNAFFGDFAFKN